MKIKELSVLGNSILYFNVNGVIKSFYVKQSSNFTVVDIFSVDWEKLYSGSANLFDSDNTGVYRYISLVSLLSLFEKSGLLAEGSFLMGYQPNNMQVKI